MGSIGLEPKNANAHNAFPVNNLTELAEKSKSQQVQNQVHILAIHPELAKIITAWPELPEDIKQAIKALVNTHRKETK
jgi:hypothetical protein